MNFQSNYNVFPNIPVVKSSESKTVPDMSFTPREIIQKFSRGEKVPLGFQGNFDCEDYPDDDRYKFQPSDDPQVLEDDPTRDPSFDFGDYVEEKHALEHRERLAAKAAQRGKGSSGSKRKARSEELSDSDATRSETISVETEVPSNDQAGSK